MKKSKTAPPRSLPADFSTSEVPAIKKPAPLPPQEVTETPSVAVPVLDQDASLKIEEAEMTTENLPEQEKRGKLLFVLGSVLGILILAGVVTLTVLYFKVPEKKAIITEPTPTPQVTEAPKTTIANADITFEVLNGSGISGQAAKYGKQLETLGFKVSSLGNAEGEHTGLTIYIVASLEAQKNTLMADIKEEFPQASYAGALTDGTTLVRLIIGK